MAEVEIYYSPTCGYCHRAMRLLDSKAVGYSAINVLEQPEQRFVMEKRTGRTSVPQIFINGKHVGGCDDLHALEAQGELDPLLAGEGNGA